MSDWVDREFERFRARKAQMPAFARLVVTKPPSSEQTTIVRCLTCGWTSTSRDAAWTRHAGDVHANILKPGHDVVEDR